MPRIVIIVEDSANCAETLQIALEGVADVDVRVFHSPRAAMAVVATETVAAIITDLHLPHADGFELLRQLRSVPSLAHLPVLLISGDSDPRLPERALASGADAFFAKPYSPAAVRRKLEELL
jgi:PleD family two-component response regulator